MSELALIQQTVRDFGAREVVPYAARWDAEGRVPAAVLAGLAELGLLGMEVPDGVGGSGLEASDGAAVIEELAACDGSLARIVSVHNALALAHLLAGSAEQRATLVPPLASGERLGAWVSGGGVVARRVGDAWELTGVEPLVPVGALAHDCVVVASTEGGPTAFLVDTATAGWRARAVDTHGLRAAGTAEVTLQGVVAPDARRIGGIGAGVRDAERVLRGAHLQVAAMAVGIARGALAAAARYASERVQFGKPIAEFQMIQWKIADAATSVDAARLLTERAATLATAGRPFAQEALMARAFATRMAPQVCSDAIQIHGGYGYTTDFPVERAWRDARACCFAEGTCDEVGLAVARGVLAAS